MNDQASRRPATAGANHLQLRKLELEIAEAELRQKLLEQKEKLDLEKLQQEILGSKIQNDTKQRMAEFEAEKLALELKEKKTATRYALPPAIWDILKYAVAVIPVILTAIGLYIGYRKDTETLRHQYALEQKFKVDTQLLPLLKSLSDDKNPVEIIHAAVALQSYGRHAIRLLVPHLRLGHANWLNPFFVESLRDVVVNEPDETKQKQAADEIVEKIVHQASLVIHDFTRVAAPETTREAPVRAHLEALTQLGTGCAPVCNVLRAALTKEAKQIEKLTAKLLAHPNHLNDDLRGAIDQLKQVLSSPEIAGSRT